ncbi:MAG: hypothetical protein ACO3JL_20480, partial [Myxococcota bacterium]
MLQPGDLFTGLPARGHGGLFGIGLVLSLHFLSFPASLLLRFRPDFLQRLRLSCRVFAGGTELFAQLIEPAFDGALSRQRCGEAAVRVARLSEV